MTYFMVSLVFHSQYASGCLAEDFLKHKKDALVCAIVQTNIWSWSSTIAIAVDTDATAILMYPLITLYHDRIVSYRNVTYIIILSASSTQGRIPGSLSRAHQSGPQRDICNRQMIMNK